MPAKVNIQAVATFLLISFTISWLAALLFMNHAWGLIILAWSPGIAALITMGVIEKRFVTHINQLRALGFLGYTSVKKFALYLGISLLSFLIFTFGALYIAVMFNLLDTSFSHLTATIATVMRTNATLFGWLPFFLLALGAEIGWRGWLLPQLLPLGLLPAIITGGILWGLSYAPVIYLGYLYTDVPLWLALAIMCGMCIVLGGVLAWLQLQSGSLWPSVLAHTVVTSTGGILLVVIPILTGDQPYDLVNFSIFGWSGWILPLLLLSGVAGMAVRRHKTPSGRSAAHP